ncbi:MAG: AAA family ATPase, partial [Thermodesulfovibrio sp.]|nr:AAA family ATPase [Thermodesulfovibrio sp.]MDW7998562.1 AAA family ATPase [Thermodesulfovibrio sp.]
MQIKWIELNGFKSFPERTKIEFNEGITCFVGPNGAGKSNIVDAFRWVLGEHNPRILRGEKMEEVIFQGSSSKKEKGLAEVTLLLNIKKEPTNGNEPETQEIEVKRRFYRTGESYF